MIAQHVVAALSLVAAATADAQPIARCGPGASIIDGQCQHRDFAELNSKLAALAALPHDAERCRASKSRQLDEWEQRYCAFLSLEAEWDAYRALRPCSPGTLRCPALEGKKQRRDHLAAKYLAALKLTRDRSSWELIGEATPAAAFWGAASLCRAAEALADYTEFMDVMFPHEPPKHAFDDPPWMLTEVVREQTIDALDDLAHFEQKYSVESPWTRRCAKLNDELREQSRFRHGKVP